MYTQPIHVSMGCPGFPQDASDLPCLDATTSTRRPDTTAHGSTLPASTRKCHQQKPSGARGPIRTPLPVVEESLNEDEEGDVWEAPSCSLYNVHRPQRKSSMGISTARALAASFRDPCLRDDVQHKFVNPAA